jgi:thiol-disulfide isomerase/thioredoxin
MIVAAALAATVLLLGGNLGAAGSARKPAPAFTIPTLDGKDLSLGSLRGSVVLLDFSATWCGYCRQAAPELEKLHRRFGSKGLVVLGVYMDSDGASAVRPYVRSEKLSYRIGLDPRQEIAGRYGVRGIPAFVLVDRKGDTRLRQDGYAPNTGQRLAAEIEKLLAEKTK